MKSALNQRRPWLALVAQLSALAVLAVPSPAAAQAGAAKIVGIGASSCARFNQDIPAAPTIERDYFAWAQGFMSGALIRAPRGVDEGLDLAPESFSLQMQADFLRAFCLENPGRDYVDAVHALYRRLRGAGT